LVVNANSAGHWCVFQPYTRRVILEHLFVDINNTVLLGRKILFHVRE
jgi:hypothetical protein